jgi:hypothetical protein
MRWGRCDDATPAYANQTYIQSFRFGCPFHGPLMAFLIAGGATHGTLRERRPVGATDDCILVKKKNSSMSAVLDAITPIALWDADGLWPGTIYVMGEAKKPTLGCKPRPGFTPQNLLVRASYFTLPGTGFSSTLDGRTGWPYTSEPFIGPGKLGALQDARKRE